jgi:hypothetical protein
VGNFFGQPSDYKLLVCFKAFVVFFFINCISYLFNLKKKSTDYTLQNNFLVGLNVVTIQHIASKTNTSELLTWCPKVKLLTRQTLVLQLTSTITYNRIEFPGNSFYTRRGEAIFAPGSAQLGNLPKYATTNGLPRTTSHLDREYMIRP